jgi:hypothetical protein
MIPVWKSVELASLIAGAELADRFNSAVTEFVTRASDAALR